MPIGSNIGEVTVELAAAAMRRISADEFIAEWRQEIGLIAGVVELSFRQETGAGGNAIDIEIAGRDLETLKKAADHITGELSGYTGVKDISTDNRMGKRELVYEEITPAGRSMGFSLQSIALQIRQSFYGEEVQRIQRGRDELKVMVRYPADERRSVENLEDVRLRSNSPLRGNGQNLSKYYSADFAGNPLPKTGAWDIGALHHTKIDANSSGHAQKLREPGK